MPRSQLSDAPVALPGPGRRPAGSARASGGPGGARSCCGGGSGAAAAGGGAAAAAGGGLSSSLHIPLVHCMPGDTRQRARLPTDLLVSGPRLWTTGSEDQARDQKTRYLVEHVWEAARDIVPIVLQRQWHLGGAATRRARGTADAHDGGGAIGGDVLGVKIRLAGAGEQGRRGGPTSGAVGARQDPGCCTRTTPADALSPLLPAQ